MVQVEAVSVLWFTKFLSEVISSQIPIYLSSEDPFLQATSTVTADVLASDGFRLKGQTMTKTHSSAVKSKPSENHNPVSLAFQQLRLLPEYKYHMFMLKYFTYITSVPGILTNLLTIYVSVIIKLQTASETHMLVLGITDLIINVLRLALHVMEYFQYSWSKAGCQILFFATNSAYMFSNWVLISWSSERFIAVIFPLKISVWCCVKNAKKVLSVFLIGTCIVMLPEILEVHTLYSDNNKRFYCWYSQTYFKIYASIQTTFYIYIPFVVIIGANASIIYSVNKATKRRPSLTTHKAINSKRENEQRQITMILILTSIVFVLLHSTQILAKIWQAIYPDTDRLLFNNLHDFLIFNLLTFAGHQITDFQNSINFFLYCAFSTKVRNTLRKQICFYCNDNNISIFKTGTVLQ